MTVNLESGPCATRAFLTTDDSKRYAVSSSGVDYFARKEELADHRNEAGSVAETHKPSRRKASWPLALAQQSCDLAV